MRCPNCNKFASYDEPKCEVNSVDIDSSSARASVTVQLNCQDCGETLKDAEIETEVEIDHECKPQSDRTTNPDPDYKEGDPQFELEDDGFPNGTSRVQSTDRNGKPIKSSRYMKTFYGFELQSEIKCRKCGEMFSVNFESDEQASSFNECC